MAAREKCDEKMMSVTAIFRQLREQLLRAIDLCNANRGNSALPFAAVIAPLLDLTNKFPAA